MQFNYQFNDVLYSERLTVTLLSYALYVIRVSSINAMHIIRCKISIYKNIIGKLFISPI